MIFLAEMDSLTSEFFIQTSQLVNHLNFGIFDCLRVEFPKTYKLTKEFVCHLQLTWKQAALLHGIKELQQFYRDHTITPLSRTNWRVGHHITFHASFANSSLCEQKESLVSCTYMSRSIFYVITKDLSSNMNLQPKWQTIVISNMEVDEWFCMIHLN